MTSTRLEGSDPVVESVDVSREVVAPLVRAAERVIDPPLQIEEAPIALPGLSQGHRPKRADHHNDNHAQQVANHPASLPPDLAALVTRDQFNEDQGDAAERDYRKGWNDHARHMLRLLAAREAL